MMPVAINTLRWPKSRQRALLLIDLDPIASAPTGYHPFVLISPTRGGLLRDRDRGGAAGLVVIENCGWPMASVNMVGAWRTRQRVFPATEQTRFAADSLLEGAGFELPVPVRQAKLTRSCR